MTFTHERTAPGAHPPVLIPEAPPDLASPLAGMLVFMQLPLCPFTSQVQ